MYADGSVQFYREKHMESPLQFDFKHLIDNQLESEMMK